MSIYRVSSSLLLALTVVACTHAVDPEELANLEEDIGTSEGSLTWCTSFTDSLYYQPLSPSIWDESTMLPQAALCLSHTILNPAGKNLESGGLARFRQFEGPFTSANLQACQDAYVRLRVFNKGLRGETRLHDLTVHAEPVLKFTSSGLEIESCIADVHSGVDYYATGSLGMRNSVTAWPIASETLLTSRVYYRPTP